MRTANRWLRSFQPRPQAKTKLICIPFAGGGASVYRSWAQELPASIEVHAVQLPGREDRMTESPIARRSEVVASLADAVGEALSGDIAFFGHSMGGLLAFELARELRRRGRPGPRHIVVSGRPAPHLPPRHVMHHLPEKEFVEAVRELGGTPEGFFDEPELVDLFMPILRADFTVNEAGEFVSEAPLACPITALGGVEDPHGLEPEIAAWREHTAAAFAMQMFPGDHFFLLERRREVVDRVAAAIASPA